MTPIYDRPVWQLFGDAVVDLPDLFTEDEVVTCVPRTLPGRQHIHGDDDSEGRCVNLPPPSFKTGPKERLILWALPNGYYTAYHSKTHGLWVDGRLTTSNLPDARP